MENTKYKDGGINVDEGMASDPLNKRLLLGLRSPVVEGNALIVPLKLRDAKAALSFEQPGSRRRQGNQDISLVEQAYRSIEWDE